MTAMVMQNAGSRFKQVFSVWILSSLILFLAGCGGSERSAKKAALDLEETFANCLSTNVLQSSIMQMITEHWTNQPAVILVTKETPEPAWLVCLKRNSALLGASIVLRESPTNSSVRMAFGGGFARYMELEIGPPTYRGLSTNEGVYSHNWFPGAYVHVSRDP
jgi:hypothetical protein